MTHTIEIIDHIPVTDEVLQALTEFYPGNPRGNSEVVQVVDQVSDFIIKNCQDANRVILAASAAISAKEALKKVSSADQTRLISETDYVGIIIDELGQILQKVFSDKSIANSAILALYNLIQHSSFTGGTVADLLQDALSDWQLSLDVFKLLGAIYGFDAAYSYPPSLYGLGGKKSYTFGFISASEPIPYEKILLSMSAVSKAKVYLLDGQYIAFDLIDELSGDEGQGGDLAIKVFAELLKCKEEDLDVCEVYCPDWSDLLGYEWVERDSW